MIAAVQHRHPASDKLVLQALVPFKLLYERAIFTQKTVEGNFTEDDADKAVDRNTQYYQRKLNQERLKEIQKFIVDTILDEKDTNAVATLFPSSMILAISKESVPKEEESFKFEFDDTPIYIVDGQHRMMAMKLLYERMTRPEYIQDEDVQYIRQYLENYRFNATILVNYDLWEQGQVFVNVNFRQKPVNKSLYYEVFGAEYSENPNDWKRNHIYVAHRLTEAMNNQKESPFCGQIKMLGTGKGYISQAFFVEAILPQFRAQGVWNRKIYELENRQNITQLGNSLNKLDARVNRVGAGAAALAALQPLDFDPDDKWDFAAGYGNYAGAHAVAIGAYYRPTEELMFSYINRSCRGGRPCQA